MLELQGIPVSPGVAIGQALILDREGYQITRCRIAVADRAAEGERLRQAVASALNRIEEKRLHASQEIGQEVGNIFSAQRQMLLDPKLQAELHRLIEQKSYSAEFAVSRVLNGYAQAFRQMEGSFLAERVVDILDIERALLEQLGGQPTTNVRDLDHQAILISHDLTPSETATLDPEKILGFCTEVGGPGGHTAIVARGLEIPAVVGVGNFMHQIRGGVTLIVDGYRGRLILDPDPDTLDRYKDQKVRRRNLAQRLQSLRDLPAETQDGQAIELLANIEFPQEVEACLERGANGIGLYRTEFLYLGSETEPSEQTHFEAYSSVLEAMQGRPVVMRTLDLGADKMGQRPHAEQEHNPFLGLRSIRLSLRNPAMFRTQLRAILRASHLGDARVMFPMITTLRELRNARLLLRQVEEDLREEGENISPNLKVGMMVEVPSAVVRLEKFIAEVDFISIGTNDLTQYTLAVDRSNESVADLYQACDPAVLQLIARSLEVANAANIPASVCGEMSSEPAYALLLIGLGVRTLSAPPSAIPQVKKAIRSVTLTQCQAMATRAMRLETAQEIDAMVRDQFARFVPDMVLPV